MAKEKIKASDKPAKRIRVQKSSSAPVEDSASAPVKVEEGAVDILFIRSGIKTYVRTFSKEIHGADFERIVKEFLSTHPNCTAVPASENKVFVVLFRAQKDYGAPLAKRDINLPFEDLEREFTDRDAAVRLKNEMNGTVLVKK